MGDELGSKPWARTLLAVNRMVPFTQEACRLSCALGLENPNPIHARKPAHFWQRMDGIALFKQEVCDPRLALRAGKTSANPKWARLGLRVKFAKMLIPI
jgi:hypothetical protein